MQEFVIEKGSIPIILSAPHAKKHKRKDMWKAKDVLTDKIVQDLQKLTDCHIMYTTINLEYDPNHTPNNNYKKKLKKYIEDNNIKYLIDIHGMKENSFSNIEIGTNKLANINGDEQLLLDIKTIINKKITKIKVDKRFKASPKTISFYISKNTKIKTIQIEISKKYRNINTKQYEILIETLKEVIAFLEGK